MQQTRGVVARWGLVFTLWVGFCGAQQPGKLDGVTYVVPAGWSARQDGGALILTPGQVAAGGLVTARFLPPMQAPANFTPWFEQHVKNNSRDFTGRQVSGIEQITTAQGDPALAQLVTGKVSGGPLLRYFLAMQRGDSVVVVQYSASSATLLAQFLPGLEGFLASVKFGPQPSSVSSSGSTTSQASTSTATPVKPFPVSTASFVASGRDPKKEPIPDEFRCYPEMEGSNFSKPYLTLQIVEGRQYRVLGQDGVQVGQAGSFQLAKSSSSKNQMDWTSGNLAGTDEAYLLFNDYGQKIDLQNVGSEEKNYDLSCYQRGPREDLARLEFSLKTPKVGTYTCQNRDGKGQPFTAEILPGNRYRVKGQEGKYFVDLLSDQSDDFSSLEFTGGAWGGGFGTYLEDESGKRSLRASRSAECSMVVKPTPIPKFGSAKAPVPPAGSGGLEGAFASWRPDVAGGRCGGLCWNFYIFNKNGYVYTDEPEANLDDANCTRTHPNGLPVCEVYTYKNGLLTIGQDKPKPLKKKADGNLDLGGVTLFAIRPVSGVKLQGSFRSFSASVGLGGTSSSFSEAYLIFNPNGTFTRSSSGGASTTLTDTGDMSGSVTGGMTALSERQNRGTYRFVNNTLELSYADGRVVRLFAFFPETQNGKPRLDFFHAGGRDYSLQEKK